MFATLTEVGYVSCKEKQHSQENELKIISVTINTNKYRNSQIYTKMFSPIFRGKTLNSLQGKKLACAKMAPRKVEGCARSGHVTGQRSLRGRGSRKGLQRAPTNTMLSSDYHLAKSQLSYELFGLFVTEIQVY